MTSESTTWFEDLPEELAQPRANELENLHARLSGKAPPTGRFARLWTLSTLGGRVAAAYSLGWLRVRFLPADERARARAETHFRAALHALGTMGYLRGAVAKSGQILASYPDVLPREVLALFESLHAEAPPMHFALLRERVRSELGGEPEQLFSAFEEEPCAAASLGQVHRAVLDGTRVAVKIQYPGMAAAVRADLANARLLLTPLRLGREWENLMAQLEELCRGLSAETDYLREALWTERVRTLLADCDGVVVPRVFPARSSAHVLTSEWLQGRHMAAFLATKPAPETRDRLGAALWRTSFRLWSSHRLFNTDPNPGNFLFFDDGRLGLIDFGAVREFDAREWELMRAGVRAQREGGAAQAECIRQTSLAPGLDEDDEAFRQRSEACDWLWEPLRKPGVFDFGADDYLARGVRLFGQALRAGHTRQEPVFLWCTRQFYGVRALLWALGARFDAHAIADEEYRRAGL
jgi:predicted unusual protein kinase regulating ubiquinone biosynthesis (AarF/ABC1/UbiB family)